MQLVTRRTREEIEQLIKEYRSRGELTRRGFCEKHGVSRSMLDYYLRHYGNGGTGVAKFVRVKVQHKSTTTAMATFSLVLSNGRRIESGWTFSEEELSRLIRIAESA